MEHIGKKSLRIILAFILAFTLMIPIGVNQRTALADENNTTTTTDTTTTDDILSIKAGAAVPKENQPNTWYFPYLSVTSKSDKLIKSITVQFTSPIEDADAINVEAADGFTLFSGNTKGNRSVNCAAGATADQWQTFLREHMTITLSDATTTKSIRMIANFEPVSKRYDYNSANGHYYEIMSGPVITWEDALKKAEEKTYMGMQGYLVTLTSENENEYVKSMIGTNCWIGLTSWDPYTSRTIPKGRNAGKIVREVYNEFYSNNGINVPAKTYAGSGAGPQYYYWVSGPEAGKLCSYGNSYNGKYIPQTAAPDPDGGMMYMKWADNEPNSSGGEQCAHFYTEATPKFTWNDFPNNSNRVTDYVVEYGGLEDDEDDSSSSTSGGGGDTNIDIVIKVEIDIDPKGKTITTSADNVRVGEPLKISENVNGDPVVKLHLFGADGKETGTEPAKVTRTYYEKQGKNWVKLDATPTKVGTYKVESTAPYRYADGTVAAEDYTPGSAEFKILPKVIDVSSNTSTPKPDDPTDPSIVYPDRQWAKIYDGTNGFTAEKTELSLGDLVVDGMKDAHLVFDSAAFDETDVGSHKLTLHNVRIEGADAANYSISGLVAQTDGTYDLTFDAVISPRPLTINPYYALIAEGGSEPSAKIIEWRVGKDLSDAQESFEINTDNLVDADKANPSALFDGVKTHHSAATIGGLALNLENPVKGTYKVTTQLSGDSVTKMGDSYCIGNYLVSVAPTTLEVLSKPGTIVVTPGGSDPDDPNDPDNPDPIKPSDPIVVKPSDPPVKPDDIIKKIEDEIDPGLIPDLPEGTEPKVEIIKGKTPVDDIDPDNPGTYHVIVTYPDPDPDKPDVQVELVYEVDPQPAPEDPESFRLVETHLKGALTSDSTISPSTRLVQGKSYTVSWNPGANHYVTEVLVDGRTIEPQGNSVTFDDISINHSVVVTIAELPAIGGSTSRGWYTVSVNRYGAANMLDCSPSQSVEGGTNVNVWWEPQEGYVVSEVMIDGKTALTPEQIEAGSYDFENIDANHVVDIRYKAINALMDVSSRDYLVSTKVVNGPGTITGGATVTPGADYPVNWNAEIQTTLDPSSSTYGVYEVSGVTVNNKPCAGANDTSLVLDNIQEDKDVVLTMRPVLYNVNIYGYSVNGGSGTVSPHRTLFKGQSYSDVLGTPNEDSRIVRVVVDGEIVFDEKSYSSSTDEATGSESSKTTTQSATANDSSAEAMAATTNAQDALDGDKKANEATEQQSKIDDIATANESSETNNGSEENEASKPADNSEISEDADIMAALNSIGDNQFIDEIFSTAYGLDATAPVYPNEVSAAGLINSKEANYSFDGVQHNHRVEVYFASASAPYEPEDSTKAKEDTPTVTPGVEGSSGTVTVVNPADPTDPSGSTTPGAPVDPTKPFVVSWDDLPEGTDPVKIVIGDPDGENHEIEVSPEDIERGYVVVDPADIPAGVIDTTGDTPVTLITEKTQPGSEDPVYEQKRPSDLGQMFAINTSIKGGQGNVTSSAEVALGGEYTVHWSAEPGYHVARVLVDGVELASLLATDHVTFNHIDGPHSVEVILEADPDPVPDPIPGNPDPDKATDNHVMITPQDNDSVPATGDSVSMIAPLLGITAVAAALVVLVLARRNRKKI